MVHDPSYRTETSKKEIVMKKGKSGNKFHLKGVLTWERNICRAIASWSLYALLILLTTEGDFFDLSFAQDKSLGSMVVLIALIFAALTKSERSERP